MSYISRYLYCEIVHCSIEDDLDKLLSIAPKSSGRDEPSKPVISEKPAIKEKPKNLPPKPGVTFRQQIGGLLLFVNIKLGGIT